MGQEGPLLWPGVSREQARGVSTTVCGFIHSFFLIELELIYSVVLISAV